MKMSYQQKTTTKQQFQHKVLLTAVKKVALMSNKTTKQIILKLQGTKILVSAEDHETGGAAMDEIEATTTGGELTIGFNSTLLIDILTPKNRKNKNFNFRPPKRYTF